MNEFRLRSNGSSISEETFRSMHDCVFPLTLTQDILSEFNVDPVLNSPIPEATELQMVQRDGVIQDALGNWVKKWKLVDRFSTQEEIDNYLLSMLQNKRLELLKLADDKRRKIQSLGYLYNFPDQLAGIIQTRDQTEDLTNVTAQTLAAIILQGQGVTDPVLSFRDTQNITHPLTPAQTIAMGMAVSQFINSIYAAKWAHDEAIKIWDGISPYDIDSGWEI